MHNPERNKKCQHESVTEASHGAIATRQGGNESLIDCAKHHNQGMDTMKSQFGTSMLDGFIKKTQEFKNELDRKAQET